MPVLPRYQHLLSHPLKPGLTWAVLTRPTPTHDETRFEYDIFSCPILPSTLDWTPSPVAAQLGFPLQLAVWPHSATTLFNKAAQCLFFHSDPASSDFARHEDGTWRGDVLFSRTDGEEVDEAQVKSLVDYVLLDVAGFVRPALGLKETSAQQSHRDKAAKKLSPEAYHAYFLEWKRQRVTAGDASCAPITSPVEVTLGEGHVAAACGTCGALAGGEGRALMWCGRCRVRFYCGVVCQKRDWRFHRAVCSTG